MELINLILGLIDRPEWAPILDAIYQIAFFIGQVIAPLLALA